MNDNPEDERAYDEVLGDDSSEKSGDDLFDENGKLVKGQEKEAPKIQLTKEELDNRNKQQQRDKKALAEQEAAMRAQQAASKVVEQFSDHSNYHDSDELFDGDEDSREPLGGANDESSSDDENSPEVGYKRELPDSDDEQEIRGLGTIAFKR